MKLEDVIDDTALIGYNTWKWVKYCKYFSNFEAYRSWVIRETREKKVVE